MNTLLRGTLGLLHRVHRRLNEKAGLVSGFSDLEMHQWMLRDAVRVEAYEAAIRSAVRPGAVVVDVGAGTGLLSMMACRAGASRVYAIEQSGIIELARRIVSDNGFADRIVLLGGSSGKVSLPERCDVVVSETIGSFVFSEEIVASLEDARLRFLAPGGAIIPERIRIFLAPVESFEEGAGFWERPVRGFDYRSALSHQSAGEPVAARSIDKRHLLDEGAAVYDLDFGKVPAGDDGARTLRFTARRDGVVHGFLGTWEAFLHAGTRIVCAPWERRVHWPPLLFRLPRGIPVRAGDPITLRFSRGSGPGWRWVWEAELTHS